VLGIVSLTMINMLVVNLSVDDSVSNFDVGLLLARAEGDSESSTVTCSKIKESCSCYNDDGVWECMSITECEDYTWYPPMTQESCTTTSCMAGSSCR
jgi:hypothetical protein